MNDLVASKFLLPIAAAQPLDRAQALALAEVTDTAALMAQAAVLRDQGFGDVVTYSRKVFLPLTKLCRDVCHYCTFASTPREVGNAYMSLDEVLEAARQAAALGCKEALLTLGERPELRYQAARDALARMGFATTLEYVAHVAGEIFRQTGLLPHVNPGCMDAAELAMLRKVSPSMGLMLESASARLCEKGMPHYGSPDKQPARRLETLRLAGEAKVPFTSGILIGIGETRRERIESLLALRELHERYGHIQEIIIQNFRAKPDTLMARAPEPDLDDLLWTIAVARLIFGADMSIQVPPNLNPGVLAQLVAAGINDWGGVSPLTPDFVNPEAPWPHLDQLANETAAAGKYLQERLTIYPQYALDNAQWVDAGLRTAILQSIDGEGLPRTDDWVAGQTQPIPAEERRWLQAPVDESRIDADLRRIVARAAAAEELSEAEIVRLFRARGPAFAYVCQAADRLRRQVNGDAVSYVVTRNINYTNVCYFKCQFCAFSKGKLSENLRGQPYDLEEAEIARRCAEAWQRGATEVCLQGGIHPDYTGQTYFDILDIVRRATPQMHIHAYSPLEVWQGAATLEMPIEDYLRELKARGLGTLPGTAAEVLDDEVRAVLCPDKINTRQWMQVIETAHVVGLKTTATIMFGHVDRYRHWARHLRRVRDIQVGTQGFTEFVPLPFVPMEAPLYLKGRARKGPTFREVVLMHAVARLALHGQIDNIQTSWVKMGDDGVALALNAGCNDLGGTLMNETITRSAGATHGEGKSPQELEALILSLGRQPRCRTTTYDAAPGERQQTAREAAPLEPVVNNMEMRNGIARRRHKLVRFAVEVPAGTADDQHCA
ncbi:FO synthase [Sterolibacterium denitrificans]|uniref:FO synthase n=1 Tax=Sterolibacterium denitrificans TaxID=157592 RepID=A0A7Z7HPR9_9PROT|nr:5-amino-6-(D-ribitylamino)uracil--L-tyrosine 4-hydroxyphenyl transferase CofH [Sterolibacterium denitrificans]SMB22493.1 FO synthase [Sterolibacterium denitrificans]